MSQLSNYLENGLVNAVLRNTSYTSPATVYAALYSATPGEADSGTEITGGAYARQSVAFAAPSNGAVQNSAQVAFPVATADYPAEVTFFGIRDASSAGNLLWYGPLMNGTPLDFVAQAATDLVTCPDHTFAANDRVALLGDNLPAGVDTATLYFVVTISGDTFKLSLTSGGAAIDLTANGSGKIVKSGAKTISASDQFVINATQLTCSLA